MRILRLPDVVTVTGLSRPTIYRLMQAGRFPNRRQLGIKSVGWVAEEIQSWLEGRPLIG
jgi:prophage regulatory protein